jgi:3-hydroxy-9,10-secoandrosta-1,3,5(10)-triene-9,17-dione monooxygenase
MTLIDEARRLAPELAARTAEADELRRLPDETWKSLHEAGLFRAMQPRRWGGSECTVREFADMIVEVSRASGSAGWVNGVIGVHPWHLALYTEEAQQEMWADDPSTMHSSSYAPVGKVTKAPGGYQLSGHWSFSSGADHCKHIVLGAMAGLRDLGGGFEVPDFRSFVLLPGQYTIVDAWHTVGAKGTGSQDIIVDDVFVPEHRTQSHVDYFIDAPLPGWELNDGPLYRLPWSVVFNYALASAVYGTALGYFDTWTRLASTREVRKGLEVRNDSIQQHRLALATYDLDAALAVMRHDLDEAWEYAVAGVPMPRERRAAMRFHANTGVANVGKAVAELHHAASGRSIYVDHELQRGFQDVQGFLGHTFLVADDIGRDFGAMRMGGDIVGAML